MVTQRSLDFYEQIDFSSNLIYEYQYGLNPLELYVLSCDESDDYITALKPYFSLGKVVENVNLQNCNSLQTY